MAAVTRKRRLVTLPSEDGSFKNVEETEKEIKKRITLDSFKQFYYCQKLYTKKSYTYLKKYFHEMFKNSDNYTNKCDLNILHKIYMAKAANALLFNSDPDDKNKLVCYIPPLDVIHSYHLPSHSYLFCLNTFLMGYKPHCLTERFTYASLKYRKFYKFPIEINKNYFKNTKYIWIRDKFGGNFLSDTMCDKNKKLRHTPLTIQLNYHTCFVFSMKNMYEDAIMCFLGYPINKPEFLPPNTVDTAFRSCLSNFLVLHSKIIPDILNAIVICAMKNYFSEAKRNIFFTKLLDFCKQIFHYGTMEINVPLSCIFSILTYDLHFRPEIVNESYRGIEIKDIYRIRSSMNKYNAFLIMSSFIAWKNGEIDYDKLPVNLFEQLKSILEENVIDYVPVLDAFICIICRFDLITDNFYIVSNAAKNYPILVPRISTRLYQENQPLFAKIIERSIEPLVDLHPSHEAWLIYLREKSDKIGRKTAPKELLEDIKIIVQLLDYGEWRKNEELWLLFNDYLFVKTKRKRIKVLKEDFKILFEERRSWWSKFHSVRLSEDTETIRTKILTYINDLFVD
ncbi:Hypothetical protein SRAE_0000043800 [Strongyloides ratti]|uniref:Uncharacterized protein n=1 Tax=Strongyloides ratti TaxID=34506 RepID=A0A090KZN3_STRRB|nr:Hypothetical protein SRAE_0000043800 [Strongyloides ratti]CEF61312.1 Hypothetical protein SRAE_0000043800 [Strongyloides ratti]